MNRLNKLKFEKLSDSNKNLFMSDKLSTDYFDENLAHVIFYMSIIHDKEHYFHKLNKKYHFSKKDPYQTLCQSVLYNKTRYAEITLNQAGNIEQLTVKNILNLFIICIKKNYVDMFKYLNKKLEEKKLKDTTFFLNANHNLLMKQAIKYDRKEIILFLYRKGLPFYSENNKYFLPSLVHKDKKEVFDFCLKNGIINKEIVDVSSQLYNSLILYSTYYVKGEQYIGKIWEYLLSKKEGKKMLKQLCSNINYYYPDNMLIGVTEFKKTIFSLAQYQILQTELKNNSTIVKKTKI